MINEKLKGIVLKEYDSGENSKRIVVFTAEKGKVTIFVKGGKGSKSKFLAGSQTFAFCDFVVYKGRDFYSLIECDVLESYYNLRKDILNLSYGAYLLELVEKTIPEGIVDEEVLRLLLRTLKVISETNQDTLLSTSIFETKYLQLTGLLAPTTNCTICGNSQTTHFSSSDGFVCLNCKKQTYGAKEIEIGTKQSINHILENENNKIFSFKVSNSVNKELRVILEGYIKEHLGNIFKTLKFAKSL